MALNNGFIYREQINDRGHGLTVLAYLSASYQHSSPREWQTRIEEGEITLDGFNAPPDARLKAGQWLVWQRPPWNEPDVPLSFALIHEDREILAVAKPAGLPSVPAGGFLEHTLLALVRRIFPEASPVHRLGRGTSGVVIFARTSRARSAICESLRKGAVTKVYRALASGVPEQIRFTIRENIGPVPHPRLGKVHAASAAGKPAVSQVNLLERRTDSSLLEVSIKTGKPHQIRIHLAYAGHPLVGDPLYATGGGLRGDGTALPGDLGYMLHSEHIYLTHPGTGRLFHAWCVAPPELRMCSTD